MATELDVPMPAELANLGPDGRHLFVPRIENRLRELHGKDSDVRYQTYRTSRLSQGTAPSPDDYITWNFRTDRGMSPGYELKVTLQPPTSPTAKVRIEQASPGSPSVLLAVKGFFLPMIGIVVWHVAAASSDDVEVPSWVGPATLPFMVGGALLGWWIGSILHTRACARAVNAWPADFHDEVGEAVRKALASPSKEK